MNTDRASYVDSDMPHPEPVPHDGDDAPREGAPAEIEQAIERIGARYLADLRALSEEFSRFYTAQLAAKDEQIAQLRRAAEAAERERDALQARVDEFRQTSVRYTASLRALSEEFSRHLDIAERERDASAAPMAEGER